MKKSPWEWQLKFYWRSQCSRKQQSPLLLQLILHRCTALSKFLFRAKWNWKYNETGDLPHGRIKPVNWETHLSCHSSEVKYIGKFNRTGVGILCVLRTFCTVRTAYCKMHTVRIAYSAYCARCVLPRVRIAQSAYCTQCELRSVYCAQCVLHTLHFIHSACYTLRTYRAYVEYLSLNDEIDAIQLRRDLLGVLRSPGDAEFRRRNVVLLETPKSVNIQQKRKNIKSLMKICTHLAAAAW